MRQVPPRQNGWSPRTRTLRAVQGLTAWLAALLLLAALPYGTVGADELFAWRTTGNVAAIVALGLLGLGGGVRAREVLRWIRAGAGAVAVVGWSLAGLCRWHGHLEFVSYFGGEHGSFWSEVGPRVVLAALPVVLAGGGLVSQSLVADREQATRFRRKGLLGMLVVVAASSLGLALTRRFTLHSGLLVETLLDVVMVGAVVASLWPAIPGVELAPRTEVRRTRDEVVIAAPGFGLATGRRALVWASAGSLLLLLDMFVLSEASGLSPAREGVVVLGWMGVAAWMEAAGVLIPSLASWARVTIRPGQVRVERSMFGRRERWAVAAKDVVLRVSRDRAGTLLDIGAGVVVAVDLTEAELHTVLAPLRTGLAVESASDAARAHAELDGLIGLVPKTSPRLASVLEPTRLWRARVGFAGHASLAWLTGLLWVWTPGFPGVAFLVTALGLLLASARLVRLRGQAESRRPDPEAATSRSASHEPDRRRANRVAQAARG